MILGPGHVLPLLHVRVCTPCPHVTLHDPHSDHVVSVSVDVGPPAQEGKRSSSNDTDTSLATRPLPLKLKSLSKHGASQNLHGNTREYIVASIRHTSCSHRSRLPGREGAGAWLASSDRNSIASDCARRAFPRLCSQVACHRALAYRNMHRWYWIPRSHGNQGQVKMTMGKNQGGYVAPRKSLHTVLQLQMTSTSAEGRTG